MGWNSFHKWLHPGKKELITFCIDNRYQYDTHKWDHAHSEFTKINWNGVLGEIKLVAVDPVYEDDMQVYPDIKNKSIKVKMTVRNCSEHTASGKISFLDISNGIGHCYWYFLL